MLLREKTSEQKIIGIAEISSLCRWFYNDSVVERIAKFHFSMIRRVTMMQTNPEISGA
jgi:hypothetical protein